MGTERNWLYLHRARPNDGQHCVYAWKKYKAVIFPKCNTNETFMLRKGNVIAQIGETHGFPKFQLLHQEQTGAKKK